MTVDRFITRSGNTLFYKGAPWHFAGCNMSWLGLSEYVGINYPSRAWIDGAMDNAVAMGANVVRTFGVLSVGDAKAIQPSLGVFNAAAFDSIDYAVAAAKQRGIRVILTLVDNYNFYLGGKFTYINWRGITPDAVGSQFFTNATIRNDFKLHISTVLNHHNPYTGYQYKHDTAILAWETGNELTVFPNTWTYSGWTDDIATFIRRSGARQLIIDGKYGIYTTGSTIDTASLDLASVDMYSNHAYDNFRDPGEIAFNASAVAAHNKTFILGEYSWTDKDQGGSTLSWTLSGMLSTVETNGINGDTFWNLVPNGITGSDNYTLHYPGDNAGMISRIASLTTHASVMTASNVTETIISFPRVPRDTTVDMWLNGTWTNIMGDVRASDGITITCGRRNETGRPEPTTCSLTLDNRSGDYSPRNPIGQYYGQIGRNTPIRVGIGLITDTFARTIVNGWGTADAGQVWNTTIGSGGTVQSSDWQVNSAVGKHSLPAADSYRMSYVASTIYRNVDVEITFSLPFAHVTGADVQPSGIVLRGQDPSDSYIVLVNIAAGDAMTIEIQRWDGMSVAAPTSVDGLSYGGQAIRVKARIEGYVIMAKMWGLPGNEPYGWDVRGYDETFTSAGFIGIVSGVVTGNTNTYPMVFQYTDFKISSPRFFGEVSSLPPKWDPSENNVTASIEAAGLLRRLGQGTAPLQSTLLRGILGLSPAPVAYWPGEDGTSATSLASALGGPAMVVSGPTKFASYSGFASSLPIPVVGAAAWVGAVPAYTATTAIQLRFIMHMPAAGIIDIGVIASINVGGTADKWELKYRAGGGLSLEVWTFSGQIMDTGAIAFDVDDINVMVSLELVKSGSNINWTIRTLEAGANTQFFFTGTLSGRSFSKAVRVVVSPLSEDIDVAIGHISVHKNVTSVFALAPQLSAYVGETAAERIERLCADNSITVSRVGAQSPSTQAMGPQHVSTLIDLLDEAIDATLGTLYEPRSELGLAYRTVASVYNQDPVELNYTAKQITPPFDPIDDDQNTRNDVIVSRTDGGSARDQLITGRMSTLEPALGGVGRYDTSATLNVRSDDQLPNLAGWLLHLGTVDETRYPVVTVSLHAPGVSSDPALCAALLDLNINDRFTIINPKRDQTPNTISQIALGYTEAISVFEHTIRINAAPESPYQTLVFDDGVSKFGTDGSTLNTGISSTTTTMLVDVDTSAGPLWTTDLLDMPIAVTMDGEDLHVIAVSGTSSPQTFTVARSVNGVVKAHSAGVKLGLTRSATLSL
jgi:hypothetical protein